MTELSCDTETFCAVPIKNGTHVYAESAEVMLFAYAVDERPVDVWDVTSGAPMPALLEDTLHDPDVMTVWQNSMFDRTVLRHALGIDLPAERIHDTMVQALAHGLPGGLGILCEIFGLPTDQAKDKRGRELINLFCKPRPKNHKLRRATRDTHPAEWHNFIEYAKLDVSAMRILRHKMPTWNYRNGQRDLWHLDQRINDRGFAVDRELARAAIAAVDSAQSGLAARTCEITHGDVGAATQRDALLRHILRYHGVELPDMQMATLERRLNDQELPATVRELIAIRLQSSTSSTSKYKKLIEAVSPDGRLRGCLQFSGASRTGRWAGRTFQPQNLPRPNLKQSNIDLGIDALKLGIAHLVYDNVMELTSNAIRSCLVAPEGKKLVVSDLANIEGRFAAWLAGEAWKLDAFRAYDNGTGPDLYILAYAKTFNILAEEIVKGDPRRQVGKVMELMLQYEGGVGAFLTGAATYGIDLDQLAEAAWDSIPADVLAEAESAWQWAVEQDRTYELKGKTYIVCDSLKRMWRRAHPAITSYWPELKDAAIEAITNKGTTVPCRKLKFRRDGQWLRMILPSGRALCYVSPKVERGKITYAGVNPYTRQWGRTGTYGGKLFENACQGGALDVMAGNMPRIENAWYEIVLTVHDEVITEAWDGEEFNSDELSRLLSTNPPWALDMPLAAGGFEAHRYRKE